MAELSDKDRALFKKGSTYRDEATQAVGLSKMSSSVAATYFGCNQHTKGTIAAPHREQFGYTFFTKPRLNLSYDNLIRERTFAELLTTNKMSRERAIRAMLDPVSAKRGKAATPLVDNNYPYIALLSNELKSLTGWRDPFIDTYTSTSGVQKEQWSMVDGPAKYYGVFELNASFRNIVTDPFGLLFHVWTTYPSLVYQNVLQPYPEAIFRHEIDYQTAIIRFTMDPTRKYITKWAATSAAFPITNPVGSAANFNEDTPFTQESEEYSISFRCMGAEYYDPIVLYEFNLRMYMFNPNFAPDKRAQYYVKLTDSEKEMFNFASYPLVNLNTKELEWYTDKSVYKAILGDKQP